METVTLLYEDYQKELAKDFKNTFLKRASDTDSSRSNDTVIDEVTDMLSTNIAVYTEKLLQRWGFSSGGEGGSGGDVTVTLDDLLKKYLSDNYVTIKGDQEVFGEKDFRKGIRIAGRRLYWDEGNDALVIEGAAYTTRWLSAKGVSPGGGGAGSGGAAAMYQLIDVSPNDTKDAVLGAEKDYVLTFDGSFWRGMPNKGGLFSKLFTALDKEGNEVNPDDENAEIYAIRANYSLWSVGFLSAKGISDGGTGGGGGGAVALYQLLDVEKNADITGVAGATKGSVLTFNGDKWYADKPKTAAGISNLFTALDASGNEVDLNDESKLGTITNIRANYALWSVDWISAKGKSSGGSGGGGGLINLVYGFESLGGTFDNNDNSATFNAFTINEIWKLASSGLTNVTVTGSGNAVTDVTKGSDGRSLTFTKGSTFATKSEFDALNTKFNDFLTGSDADDIINKWSELEVFLQGMKESDNLAVILQSKMDKTAFSKLFTALDASGNEVDLNDESKLGTITNIRANYALWSVDWISAKGKSSGGSGGGGGLINLVYGFESLGGTFDNNDNSATFNAFTINEIWKLASSGLTNVTVTGSGNAVTDVTKGSDGRSLTFTKGSTFATKSEFDALNTKFNDFLTGSDADDIINKWSELEVFLQGMKESDNLAVILQSKMDKTAFSKLFTALDASGNEVDPSDSTKTIASIRANFGFWGVDYISAKGVSKGSGGTGGASTLYQLVDVLANDTEDGVEGAAAGKALVFDGTHWRAGDAGLNESQLYSYLTANKYLTQSAADSRYVTSSRKVIAGTGLSGGGALTSNVTLSLGTSGVVAGTYTKVIVDAYGRVTSGTNLSATDIPNLDWSKINTGKPTTLAGYGITDAYTKTEADRKYVTIATAQTVSGAKTFSATMKTASVLPSTDANSALGGTANRWSNVYSVNGVFSQNVTAKLLSASESLQIGDAYLKWDAANNAVYVVKKDGTTPVGFYSTDWLSAKGVSKGSGGTGGASTLYQLVDVLANDTEDGVEGAAAGKALVFDGTHWRAGDAGLNESQLYSYLTANKYLTQSAADSRYVTSSRKVIAGTGLSGGGALTSNVTLSLGTSGVVAGTYTKVIVDAYGRVTSGTNLSATDIPNLDWSKINTGKPTTLAGYGITDAYTKTEADRKYVTIATAQTVSGAKTFSATMKTASVLPSTDANSALGGTANRWSNVYSVNGVFSQNVTAKLLSASESLQIGDAYLKWDAANNAVYVVKKDGTTPVGFYSTDWLSAKGVSMSGVQTGTLAGLNDVEITDPTNGQALKYDAASKKWVNGTIDSFNVNQMWAELKKADSSKVIDASHIPTSVLDGRWVKKAGDTMTGTLTSASSSGSIVFKGVENCDITNIYKDNGVIRNDDGGLTSIRNGLRFNWYDTYWYIGNLRGGSTESAGFGVVNHNNKLVLRVTPNDVRAPRFMSTVATGTAPFTVSSTTQVSNLNADLLDDRHGAYYQNRVCDTFVSQYNQYDYIEFLRFVIPSGQNQFRAYVIFDLCRVETGGDMNGRAVLRIRRNADNIAGTLFYVTNFGRTTLPELRCTSDDGITWRIWMKCNKSDYDPYIAVKIVEQYPYGYVTTQNNGTTGTPEGTRHVFTALSAGISNAANFLVNSRTLWGQPFNGTANVSGDMTGVGSITMSGDLKIGNGTSPNTIYFYGTTGDNPGGYKHTFIAERLWGGTESSELVLFKGDDIGNGNEAVNVSNAGPDRIRHIAAAHLFQTYTSPLAGSVEDVCTSSALKSLFGIAANRVTSYVPFMSTVASGTAPFIVVSNTVVGNLNADLLDGFHENSFLRHRDTYGIDGYNTLWAQIGIRQYNNAKPDGMANPIYDYGAVISLPGGNARLDIWYNHTSSASDSPTNGIQYRSGWSDDKKPWRMLLDSVNYASYSDGRYVKKSGDTMTGDLTMNNTKGFNIGWSTRVVKTSSVWIHGGSDAASVDDANLRFGSWNGIGWYPTISGQTVAQGKNAMWLNVRTGVLDVHSNITSHNGYLAANWDSARRLVLGSGSSYAWIDLRDSSDNSVLNNIVLDYSYTGTMKEMRAPYFKSTVGTGTQPYQCNSTTLNTNLNADMLDNWHLNFLPRNYNIGRCYAVRFALGDKDNGWKKIFACSESGTGPYRSVTVWGKIWYAYGSHAQSEVFNYHFCAIFYMRSGPSSSNSSVGNVENSARLYLPTFAKGMDNIRLVRVGTNNFEIQVRQIGSYHNANIEYQYWSYGCNVSAWENLQSTSNTSVAVSAGGASTLADSRASSADVWTSARTFYIQDHNAAHTGAGVSVNGSSNVYLKLPNSIQCGDWFRSTGNSGWYHQDYGGGWYMTDNTYIRNFGGKRLLIQTDTYDTLRLVRTSGSGGSSIAFYNGGGTFRGQLGVNASSWFSFDTGTATANQNVVEISPAGGIHSKAEITAKASGSDIRLKKDIQNYNAMNIINRFRSVKYHWNDIAKANSEVYNNDYDQFGLIAQDLIAGGFEQWVRDVFHDYYTVTYERLIPVVWKGLQEVDDEVTKLKREVARLNKRVKELEKSLCA